MFDVEKFDHSGLQGATSIHHTCRFPNTYNEETIGNENVDFELVAILQQSNIFLLLLKMASLLDKFIRSPTVWIVTKITTTQNPIPRGHDGNSGKVPVFLWGNRKGQKEKSELRECRYTDVHVKRQDF